MNMFSSYILDKIMRRVNSAYWAIVKSYLFCGKLFVECPCCGWKGKEFMSYGVISRKNAVCPKCGSAERHRLCYLYLKEVIPKDRKIRVLHFAPERCIASLFKSYTNIDYLSVDIDSKKAMTAQDITNLSFSDNSFDIIFCSHVLEHVIDDRKAMSEMCRVLKPEGFAIIQAPIREFFRGKRLIKTYEDFSVIKPEERERVFGQKDHVRIYGEDYKKRLEKAGFKVKIIEYAKSLGSDSIDKFSLIPHQEHPSKMEGWIYLCTKF